jgi:hypothetical protein
VTDWRLWWICGMALIASGHDAVLGAAAAIVLVLAARQLLAPPMTDRWIPPDISDYEDS